MFRQNDDDNDDDDDDVIYAWIFVTVPRNKLSEVSSHLCP